MLELSHSLVLCVLPSVQKVFSLSLSPVIGYRRIWNTAVAIACRYSVLTDKPASTGHWNWL